MDSDNRYQRGQWTAIRGKLSTGDAREAYVTGPAGDGVIRPIASFWRWVEAVNYVNAKIAHVDKENGTE